MRRFPGAGPNDIAAAANAIMGLPDEWEEVLHDDRGSREALLLAGGLAMLHLLTLDARWLPARADERRPVLLYDGECGLCAAVVRVLLREDAAARLITTGRRPQVQTKAGLHRLYSLNGRFLVAEGRSSGSGAHRPTIGQRP